MNLAALLATTLKTAPLRGLLARRDSLPEALTRAVREQGLHCWEFASDEELRHFLAALQCVPGSLVALYRAPDAAALPLEGPVLVLQAAVERIAQGLDARVAPQWRPMLLEAAARSLRSETPVILPLAIDILNGAAPEGAARAFYTPPVAPAPTAAALERIEDSVAQAEKAVWLLGSDCAASPLWRGVRELVERSGLPAWLTPAARGVLPQDHPLCLGVIRTHQALRLVQAAASTALPEAELCLALGVGPRERSARQWLRQRAESSQVYLLGRDLGDQAEGLRGLPGSVQGWLRRLRFRLDRGAAGNGAPQVEPLGLSPALEDLKQRWAVAHGGRAADARFMIVGSALREAVQSQLHWSCPQPWLDLALDSVPAAEAAWRGASAAAAHAPPLVLYDPRDLSLPPSGSHWQALPLAGLRRASVSSLVRRVPLAGAQRAD